MDVFFKSDFVNSLMFRISSFCFFETLVLNTDCPNASTILTWGFARFGFLDSTKIHSCLLKLLNLEFLKDVSSNFKLLAHIDAFR